jgi:pimeloyl-ACP methyl ester carboxylesterase
MRASATAASGSFTICGAAVLALAACGGTRPASERAAGVSVTRPVEALSDCFVPVTAWSNHDCGYVVVPESRTNPNSRTIKLGYLRLRTSSTSPGTPVINGVGGPGISGIANADAYVSVLTPVLAQRDVILLAQRGTQFSQPYLTCPGYADARTQAWTNGSTREQRLDARANVLAACKSGFVAEGVDLSAYNSEENATDVVELAQALGYARFDYAGQSYGTLLGQFIARKQPPSLASLVLDGVVPARLQSATDGSANQAQDGFRAVFAACQAQPACAAAYPDSETALRTVFARAEASPLSVATVVNGNVTTVQADGTLMMSGLYASLYDPAGIAALPRALALLQQGQTGALAAGISAYLTETVAPLMHYAVVCTDDPPTSVDASATGDVLLPYRALAREQASDYVRACGTLGVTQLPARSDEAVVSTVPALLLSGGLDPATPPAWAAEVAQGLSHATSVTFPAATHVIFSQPDVAPCASTVTAAFLRASGSVDTSCVMQAPAAPAFVLDQTASFTDASGARTASFTAGTDYHAGNPFYSTGDGQRLLGVLFLRSGSPIAESIGAAKTALVASGFSGDVAVIGNSPAGAHTATLARGTGTWDGASATLDLAVISEDSGTYVIVGVSGSTGFAPMHGVDLPLVYQSLRINGI